MPQPLYVYRCVVKAKSFVFAGPRSCCLDFLFEILIEEGRWLITFYILGHTEKRIFSSKVNKLGRRYNLLSGKKETTWEILAIM